MRPGGDAVDERRRGGVLPALRGPPSGDLAGVDARRQEHAAGIGRLALCLAAAAAAGFAVQALFKPRGQRVRADQSTSRVASA